MWTAHQKAATDILRERSESHGGENLLDLHGLHVREAVDAVRSAIDIWKKNCVKMPKILVGTGYYRSKLFIYQFTIMNINSGRDE